MNRRDSSDRHGASGGRGADRRRGAKGPVRPRASNRPTGKKGGRASGGRRAPIKVTAAPDAQTAGASTEATPDLGDGLLRLNRFLALAGVCSRRAADALIKGGAVAINGTVIRELGQRIDPINDEIICNGQIVKPERPTYILFNKPKGVVCTNSDREHRRRVIDFLPTQCGRLFTVGRLDADSEGLVLATNDGQFSQRISHPRHGVAKTYAVLVRGRVDREAVDKARGGVWLAEGRTAESKIVIERTGRDRTYLKVSLREGRNREIRRIFAKLGHSVISLKRVRIGPLSLHGLGRGRYRFLTREEVDKLGSLGNDA